MYRDPHISTTNPHTSPLPRYHAISFL